MGINGVAAGYYPAGYAGNQTAKTASEKNFAEIAAQKAAGTDTVENASEKYSAVVDSIGHNAPEKVKQAFTEAEKETGGFFAGGGMWISADGKESRWLVDKERQFYESFLDKLLALSEESAKTSAKETVFAEKVSATEKTGGVAEISEADRLEAFKKEIWNEINSLPWDSRMNISIQITDKAFERMMDDPEFKEKMMGLIREEAAAAHPPGDTSLTWIDENGYKGYAYMDIESGHKAFSTHSKDRNSFYVRKKQDYTELWEEKWLERERLRKERDREYVDKLYFNRSLLRKEQASAAYEANVLTEQVEHSGFDSAAIGANA